MYIAKYDFAVAFLIKMRHAGNLVELPLSVTNSEELLSAGDSDGLEGFRVEAGDALRERLRSHTDRVSYSHTTPG